MDIEKIGEHIREYRKVNNMYQRELAERLFVTDKAVSRWELGLSFPDIELIPKIAEILGISVSELLGENLPESDGDLALKYREECDRLSAECADLKNEIAKHKKQEQIAANKKKKRVRLLRSVYGVFLIAVVSATIALLCYEPKYTLTLNGITTSDGLTSIKIRQGEKIPTVDADGKTLLGYIDEDYNYYTQENFGMPKRNVTLRPLLKEEMPLFCLSDGNDNFEKIGEHVLTDEGIPATRYNFEPKSVRGSFKQARPVSDSGDMKNINVYVPSLGKRFILLSVKNDSKIDVKIKYRVENYSEKTGGLDYYTPSILLKADKTAYIPIYLEGTSSYTIFNGCDHYVILDQDISEEVNLTIFGYIYTAEELYDIEIASEPDKIYYEEGDPIDLDGLEVNGLIRQGSVTGVIKIVNYECDVRGKNWNGEIESFTVSFAGKRDNSYFYSADKHKIAFCPAVNLNNVNEEGKKISAKFTTASDGMPAAKFTVYGGAEAGAEVEGWIPDAVKEAKNKGINLRIPTFEGKKRLVELLVANDGGEEVTFYYYAENYGDRGGVTVTVAPNETKRVYFKVDSETSLGCNYAFRLMSDVEIETALTIHGYFYHRNELSGIDIYKEATRKTFFVGETFSTEGLVVKADGVKYNDVVISNYAVDLKGYVFSENDVGKRIVTVKFEDYTVTYEIEVLASAR